jgi:hypothetical protein
MKSVTVSQIRYDPLYWNTGRHLWWIRDNVDPAGYLLQAGSFFSLSFDHEYEGDMLLRKVGWLSTDYTALYPRKENSSLTYFLKHNHWFAFSAFPLPFRTLFMHTTLCGRAWNKDITQPHATLLTPDIIPLPLFFAKHTQQRVHLPSRGQFSLCHKSLNCCFNSSHIWKSEQHFSGGYVCHGSSPAWVQTL